MRITTLGEPLTPPEKQKQDDTITQYLQTRNNLTPESKKAYQSVLRIYHKYLGKTTPNQHNKKSFLDYKRYEGRSKDTITRYEVIIRGYLAYLEGRV